MAYDTFSFPTQCSIHRPRGPVRNQTQTGEIRDGNRNEKAHQGTNENVLDVLSVGPSADLTESQYGLGGYQKSYRRGLARDNQNEDERPLQQTDQPAALWKPVPGWRCGVRKPTTPRSQGACTCGVQARTLVLRRGRRSSLCVKSGPSP